ncbi:MAG TPA: acetyl-CoA carboxylase biotin carboxyl carrier protein subunit [Panacibacter sp.]|nr:acetyl-CoA carboxylase biotin carboxyl carrier protein subunit [Panacibacter sp.]HNP43773.1 acetyl-CoA carboxylase biotin carboxyl carrier protein subunit [Panacibacter sp.]
MSDEKKSFKVKSNEFVFAFDKAELAALDIFQKSPTWYNLIKDHKSINATIVDANIAEKMVTVEVDGESYTVNIKDELDQMLEKMGFGASSTRHVKEIKAPMPGLVLQVSVKEGQEVKEGERILILEAMKMENSITLHTNATIKKIRVINGQAVEKGQVLVELE